MYRLIVTLLLLFFITACSDQDHVKKIISSKNAPEVIGPYSQAVQMGNIIFLSGQIAINPETNKMVTDDFEKETRQVLDNIKAVLKEAGYEMKHIVKATVYLTDLDNYSKLNKIYSSYFDGDYPARVAVEIDELPKKANIEISVIAKK